MKILLVRLRLVGDVVFTTPLVRALRRRHPDAHLAYAVEPLAEAVVRGNPHLDEVLVVPRLDGLARLRSDLSTGWQLRRRRFDVAIDLHGGPRSSWLTWASGAPMRIGYTIPGRSWMYTHTVTRAADLAPRHSVESQWDLLAPLGATTCDPAGDSVEMTEDPAAAARVIERLARIGLRPDQPLVVMHVSAGNRFRQWPAASFESLIVDLVRRDPARRIILTAGPSDAGAAALLAGRARRQLGALGSAVPDAGEFDLAELRAVVALASVYIGGDSGPLHVAATTRTPIVALLGPTLPERSKPWRDPQLFSAVLDAGPLPCRPCHQRRCEPGDFRCLTGIGPQRVLEAAERALRRAGEPAPSPSALR